ncbi:hypothetical protein HAX54_037603 [Datura stramonium]|uniref:Uncharacterized protein n=1 Tax=Datura stramonium TaxID=4076 RepID=A0ABS8SH54_DATST|nr:hypothetical protein [Datura stramonium]
MTLTCKEWTKHLHQWKHDIAKTKYPAYKFNIEHVQLLKSRGNKKILNKKSFCLRSKNQKWTKYLHQWECDTANTKIQHQTLLATT